jgi:methyl-accepting chemotaxis protein
MSTDSNTSGNLEVLRLAFEASPQATLQLDRDLVVTAANRAAQTLLTAGRAFLEGRLPGLDVGRITGTGLRPLFAAAGEAGSHRGGCWQIAEGGIAWQFTWTPAITTAGDSLGGTLVLEDVTRSIQAQSQATSLHSMIDGAGTYFMMCDSNLCITYVNPAVKAMFRQYQQDIRRYLPTFDVDRLIGQNIDQFHRQPEHQRRLLANPALLPVTSEVKIGELEFGVTANLLSDATGKPIGIGVEWSDRNDDARYRREVDGVIEAIHGGKLDHRGDTGRLSAMHAPMMKGINTILDAMIEPVTVARDALRQISEKDLTVRITQDYQDRGRREPPGQHPRADLQLPGGDHQHGQPERGSRRAWPARWRRPHTRTPRRAAAPSAG